MTMTVAIVGRPNVGKSTLFNRLVGKKLALVDDSPGVTRDRRMADAKLLDLRLRVIDTAGLEQADEDSLEGRMRQQTELAVLEADVTLFMIDARAGVTPVDTAFANLLRKVGKPVVLAANKAEGNKGDAGFYEAFSMGFGEPVAISAEHGEGIVDLRDALEAAYETVEPDGEFSNDILEADDFLVDEDDDSFEDEETVPVYDETKPLRIAVVGRPNDP